MTPAAFLGPEADYPARQCLGACLMRGVGQAQKRYDLGPQFIFILRYFLDVFCKSRGYYLILVGNSYYLIIFGYQLTNQAM